MDYVTKLTSATPHHHLTSAGCLLASLPLLVHLQRLLVVRLTHKCALIACSTHSGGGAAGGAVAID